MLPYKKLALSPDTYYYLSNANLYIGELKGVLDTIPNLPIILKLINVDEAKYSTEIEKITSTHKNVFLRSIYKPFNDPDALNINNYINASSIIYEDILKTKSINEKTLTMIQDIIVPDQSGFRKLPGLKIYNKYTNDVIHVPPQNENAIGAFYDNLLEYINSDDDVFDPLINMAIIHYQFECIHPYKDGNGRVGRILNVSYLVYKNRLTYPILDLSKFLLETQDQYFEILYKCHNDISYLEEFIIYILKAITETAKYTINLIHQVNRLYNQTNEQIKKQLPKIYSEQLVHHIYLFLITKNDIFKQSLNLSRTTATKYLKLLVSHGFLEETKKGKETIYINVQLYNIFEK